MNVLSDFFLVATSLETFTTFMEKPDRCKVVNGFKLFTAAWNTKIKNKEYEDLIDGLVYWILSLATFTSLQIKLGKQ